MMFQRKEVYMDIKTNTTNLLAISAHPDDTEIMAMDGILKAYGSKKYAFYACVVANGTNCVKMGKYTDWTDKEMIEARAQEQLRASQIGEYADLYQLKRTEADIENGEIVLKDIQKILAEVQPDVVYTHNVFDKNPIHQRLAQIVIDAIMLMEEDARPRLVYGCELHRALNWLPDRYKVTFDLSDNKELQNRLIGVYDTRAEQSRNYVKAVLGRKMANATFITGDATSDDEERLIWYGINLTPVVQKNIPLKEFCTKVLSDFNKEALESIKAPNIEEK